MSVGSGDKADYGTVRTEVATALADIRGCTSEELEADAATAGGNLEIDSKEAEVIIARVETVLDAGKLARASDLEPEQLAGLDTLSRLLHERMLPESGTS